MKSTIKNKYMKSMIILKCLVLILVLLLHLWLLDDVAVQVFNSRFSFAGYKITMPLAAWHRK